jgi:DNA replication initiation complex subunit (GINS family)
MSKTNRTHTAAFKADDLVTLPTSRARGFVHKGILGRNGANSCPMSRNRLNGY